MLGYDFEVNHYQRTLRGLKTPLRVAHLSDLHIGFFVRAGSLRRWVRATLERKPDLIVITGDLTDSGRRHQVLPTLAELQLLQAPLGTWAVWGNHDYRFNHYQLKNGRRSKAEGQRSLDFRPSTLGLRPFIPPRLPMTPPVELERLLSQLGVRFLHNTGVQLRDDLYLAGVEDLWHGEPDVTKALSGRQDSVASLLICHNPDYLYQVPPSVDLTLCGHTHGGQLVLPWYGPAFTSSNYGHKFTAGWVDDPAPAFISRGLGLSTVPIRVACVAELVIHSLEPL